MEPTLAVNDDTCGGSVAETPQTRPFLKLPREIFSLKFCHGLPGSMREVSRFSRPANFRATLETAAVGYRISDRGLHHLAAKLPGTSVGGNARPHPNTRNASTQNTPGPEDCAAGHNAPQWARVHYVISRGALSGLTTLTGWQTHDQ